MEYWYLFPVGVVIAVCAMSSGISGSSFWTPVYLLWLALEPKVAFWGSLGEGLGVRVEAEPRSSARRFRLWRRTRVK